jgi:bacterioferritin-associated ferredoxin
VIKVEIPFKAQIVFDQTQGSLRFSGSADFCQKLITQKNKHGCDPQKWQVVRVVDGDDVLLNEFILKCQNNYKIPYEHEELCHCRMVQTEKVLNVIKQGVFITSEISRVTAAGTGCGSCKKDIDEITKYLVK